MQNNFGLDSMLFEVETVMSQIGEESPTPFIEITSIEGDMTGLKFIIGEFRFTDTTHDNGDGELQFSVSFVDKTKEENDQLLKLHIETINHIVYNLIEDLTNNSDEVVKDENL